MKSDLRNRSGISTNSTPSAFAPSSEMNGSKAMTRIANPLARLATSPPLPPHPIPLAPDPSQADPPQRLAGHLDAQEDALLPPASLHRGSGLRNILGQGQEEGKGVLGGRQGIAARGVHHQDPASCRRLDVHIVHPDARSAHPLPDRKR